MDISAKVLREVEFHDRLRGYDTDEVDDFLERAAVGFDELSAMVQAANERAERAERQAAELPVSDDESIKRTLVLAQRTADMAVREAKEEADAILSEARSSAVSTLEEAREGAERMRTAAELELQSRIESMRAEQARLEREVSTLVGLVEAEQARLQHALRALLGYVDELSPRDASRASAAPPAPSGFEAPRVLDASQNHSAPDDSSEAEESTGESLRVSELFTTSTTPLFPESDDDDVDLDDDLDFPLVEVERQVTEDANRAVDPTAFRDRAADPLDPDEALWDRWARMGDSTDSEEEN